MRMSSWLITGQRFNEEEDNLKKIVEKLNRGKHRTVKAIKENLNTSFLAQSADKIYYTGSERKKGDIGGRPSFESSNTSEAV